MSRIYFFSEDVEFKLTDQIQISHWIERIVTEENFRIDSLNFIFCSDKFLLSINQRYLGRDYFTDVITFNYSEILSSLEGDIFISIDRVQENALSFQIPFLYELYHVIIHGVLHLLGFDDNNPVQKNLMIKKEEYCLSLLKF